MWEKSRQAARMGTAAPKTPMRAGTTAVALPAESGKSVVFDLTTDDPQDQTAVLRALTDDVRQALARPHVSFNVCEIAKRNQKRNSSPTTGHFGRSDGSTNT